MKTIAFLLLVAAGCAAAPVRPSTAPSPEASTYAPRAVRLLGHELRAARPPPMRLLDVTLGLTTDSILRGATPGGSGYVPCSTSSTVATWQTPASCGLATGTNYWVLTSGAITSSPAGDPVLVDQTGSTTTTPALMGFDNASGVQAHRLRLGDSNTGIQGGFGLLEQFYSYHGIEIWGDEAGTVPAFSSTDRASVDVIGAPTASGGPALIISKNVSGTITHGTAISFSARVTATPNTIVTANLCVDTAGTTMTGVVTGAECDWGSGGGAPGNIMVGCYASAANTIKWHFCNVTAANITTTATFSCRCWNN